MKRSLAFSVGAVLACVIGFGAKQAWADTFTWSPTTTGAIPWSADANWNAVPVSGSGTRLAFVDPSATVITPAASPTYYLPNNDIAGDFQLNILDLQGTYTAPITNLYINVTGNPLLLVPNGGVSPVVNLNATRTGTGPFYYNVNNALKLNGPLTLAGNGGATFAFNGAISDNSGANGLVKNGNTSVSLAGNNSYAGSTIINGGGGTVTLSGTNTTTGPTILNAGLLNINNAKALGTGAFTIAGDGRNRIDNTTAGAITLTNNNVQYWNGDFAHAATANSTLDLGTGAVTLGANRKVTVNNAGFLKVGGVISGAGTTLEKLGTGTLTLYGANAYAGTILVTAGTLALGSANTLGSAGTVSFGGGTLKLFDTTDISARFSQAPNQSYTFDTPSNVTFATPLTSSGGSLTKGGAGTGTLTLSAANSYTGPTTVNLGKLALSGAGTFGNTTSTLTVAGSGILDLGGQSITAGPVTLTAGTVTNGTLTGTSYTVGGASVYATLAGTGVGLTENGSTLLLYGANTYTGDTTINNGGSGGLQLGFNGAARPGSDVISASSAWKIANSTVTLDCEARTGFQKSQTVNGLTVNAPGASSIRFITGNASSFMRLTLGAITRNAGSTIDFGKPNSNTTISPSNGCTTATGNGAAGILGGWATFGGTDWAANNGNNIVAYAAYTDLSGTSPSISDGPNTNVRVSNSSTNDIGQAAGTVTINTLLGKDSTNRTITIGANNTLRFGANGGIFTPSGGALTLGAAGNAGTITAGGVDNAPGDLVINNATTITNNATITDNGSGVVSLTKSGAGSLTLASSNAYTGGTFVNAGSLFLSPGTNRLATNSAITVIGTLNLGTSTQNVSGAVTLLSGSIANGMLIKAGGIYDIQSGTLSASLGGSAGLTKTTAGALAFANTIGNSFTGTTTITQGAVTGGGATNVVAINGDLIVGSPNGGPAASFANLNNYTSFNPGKNLTIYSNGTVNFGNGSQNLNGGTISILGGTLNGGSQLYNYQTVNMTGGNYSGTIYAGSGSTRNIITSASATTANISASFVTCAYNFTVADGAAPVDLNFSGSISGFNLGKLGAGLMAVTASAGCGAATTTIGNNGGTLLVNNIYNSGTGSGLVTVNTNATLGGIGIIGGVATYSNANVTLVANTSSNGMATIWPGTIDAVTGSHIPGTLTVGSSVQTNSVTFGKFTRLAVQLGATPASCDCLAVNGYLNLGAASNTNYLDIATTNSTLKGGIYTLATFNVLTGRFTTVRATLPGRYAVSYQGTPNGSLLLNGSIVVTVPNQGTALYFR